MIVEVTKDNRSKKQKWIDHLEGLLDMEKQKVAGYEQLAKVHSAYIAILLRKLDATEDNPINIKASDVTQALEMYESRAIATNDGFGLYYEVKDK